MQRRARVHQAGWRRGGGGAVASAERPAAQTTMAAKGRVIGANDRINVGFIGCGGG